ncbi:Uncharacterized conserved protein, DUF885 familyt [Mucilaginibacter pineti]|uniref:Uncharacterized conserved protein, DUF885 familyt n=1 Tax=Mucilaginibacter pineti TaxID=1391627 RepID=A0A1G6W2U2_9SPHI|nr:DUF885 domain-containing protein [Mucilaginibacter pineti]SDD60260.1 Uncharacterized conserved protein, DUF885 familyt [Mucilaginibacter pineti]
MIKNIFFKLFVAVALVTVVLTGCKKEGAGGGPMLGKDDAAFAIYENSFLDALWKQNPDWATSVGYHKYDSVLLIPNEQSRQKTIEFARLQADSLSRFEVNSLTEANRIDYKMMQNQLDYTQWQINQLKSYEWDPSAYNVIGTFAFILNENYAPLTKRVRSIYEKMANIPLYYKEAQKQIKNPVAELTSLAIEQNLGGLDIFEKDLADSLKKTSIPKPEQKLITDRAALSVKAIKDYTEWLKALKNDHPRSFRLGKDLYEDKFKFEVVAASTAQQVYNSAVNRKKFLHHEMAKISRTLWPKYFGTKAMPADTLQLISQMIDTLSSKHVKPDEFQSAIVQLIPKLNAFVKSKDLLTLDPSKPLVIRKEPGYMAGVAGASMSGPGPYDKGGNAYYNVGSLAGWSKEKAESYLREYNQYIIQILSIHEAVPGHYVQSVYANKAPSIIKSVFGNGAMAEGWAVYTEQMMLDAGYGNNEPEMLLMWYKWHLRSVCNTILDYSVHSGSMTKEQAIKMLTTEAFQQQAEADGKWKRVSVTSVQLTSYYTGYKEITDLRDAYKEKMGDKYKLKEFNEKFLSYGSAPVKFIREAMLAKAPETGK